MPEITPQTPNVVPTQTAVTGQFVPPVAGKYDPVEELPEDGPACQHCGLPMAPHDAKLPGSQDSWHCLGCGCRFLLKQDRRGRFLPYPGYTLCNIRPGRPTGMTLQQVAVQNAAGLAPTGKAK